MYRSTDSAQAVQKRISYFSHSLLFQQQPNQATFSQEAQQEYNFAAGRGLRAPDKHPDFCCTGTLTSTRFLKASGRSQSLYTGTLGVEGKTKKKDDLVRVLYLEVRKEITVSSISSHLH